jgi:hypothetical protein
MRPEDMGILAELREEARVDAVGLWEIVKLLKAAAPEAAPAEIRSRTLSVVQAMLAEGFEAEEPPYAKGGSVRWSNQEASYVTDRIDTEWNTLGRDPSIADIVWFRIAHSKG